MTEPGDERISIRPIDVQNTILDLLTNRSFTRNCISYYYAWAIMGDEEIDFKKVNEAIINRWSLSGLMYIKTSAWKLIKDKRK